MCGVCAATHVAWRLWSEPPRVYEYDDHTITLSHLLTWSLVTSVCTVCYCVKCVQASHAAAPCTGNDAVCSQIICVCMYRCIYMHVCVCGMECVVSSIWYATYSTWSMVCMGHVVSGVEHMACSVWYGACGGLWLLSVVCGRSC